LKLTHPCLSLLKTKKVSTSLGFVFHVSMMCWFCFFLFFFLNDNVLFRFSVPFVAYNKDESI